MELIALWIRSAFWPPAGMRARMQSLDLVANNMANSSTSGYKGDSEFYTVFTSEAAAEDPTNDPAALPMIQRQWTDFSQGLLEPTNNPLGSSASPVKASLSYRAPPDLCTRATAISMFLPDGTLVNAEGYRAARARRTNVSGRREPVASKSPPTGQSGRSGQTSGQAAAGEL